VNGGLDAPPRVREGCACTGVNWVGVWGWGAPIRVREEFRSNEGEMKGEGCLLPHAYGRAVHALGGGCRVMGSPSRTGGMRMHWGVLCGCGGWGAPIRVREEFTYNVRVSLII